MKKIFMLSLVASSILLAQTDMELLKKRLDEQQKIIEQLMSKVQTLQDKESIAEKKPEYLPEFNNVENKQKELIVKEDMPEFNEVKNNANQSVLQSFSQRAFTPDISLIVDTSLVSRDKKDSELKHLEVPGVAHGLLSPHSHGDGGEEATYNAKDGFNLNYAELVISSNVDPYFRLDGVFHFSEEGVEIEEAYFTTTALDYGFRVKAGKFLSDFGYINSKHHHAWDFNDMPLVFESFLGQHGINEIGAQVQWIAPTSTYFMLGAEVLNGDNEAMFGNDSIGEEDDQIDSGVKAPSMFVTYAKSSYDFGDTTIFGGVSYVYGDSRIDHSDDEEDPHAFVGDSSLYGADLLVTHFFDSYSALKWQSEVLYRDMDGTQYSLDDSGVVLGSADLEKKQAGLYTQLVYGINQSWRVGARYDSIFKNDVYKNGSNQNYEDDLNRYSAMLEYQTSEFARFRLQYNRNEAMYDEDGRRQDIDTIMLQANIAIGAHGAHSF